MADRDHGLREAVSALLAGGLVVYPTETCYGLGADASNEAALGRLVEAKGREAGKPVSVLVASTAMLESVAATVPEIAARLAARFWPGPLTLVLPARHALSRVLTGTAGTIGVRMSSHPLARALVAGLGRPLTTTSANLAGEPAATSVVEARRSFGAFVAVYVDGGRCGGGAASTVVDCTGERPRILRAGAIGAAAIAAAAGAPVSDDPRHPSP